MDLLRESSESVKLLKKEGSNLNVVENNLSAYIYADKEDNSHTLWKGLLEGSHSIKKGDIIERLELGGAKLEVMRVAPIKEPELFSMNFKGKLLTELTLKDYVSDNSLETTKDYTINNENKKYFIGHGGSSEWLKLKDFLEKTLKLPYEEFNRIPQAGKITSIRLKEMLGSCCMAFLIMTGEDEHTDGTLHARENVIHEIGLFQSQLGYERAIILLEEGCEIFSNIQGITYISFPKGNIKAVFEDIREVLKRESILE